MELFKKVTPIDRHRSYMNICNRIYDRFNPPTLTHERESSIEDLIKEANLYKPKFVKLKISNKTLKKHRGRIANLASFGKLSI